MKSVPATPEFFDLAGAYITYNSNGVDPEVEAKKYEVQSGLFSAIGGFFGGKWQQTRISTLFESIFTEYHFENDFNLYKPNHLFSIPTFLLSFSFYLKFM